MSLTLVKEDGTGKSTANSYASVADAEAYHAGHLYASAWTAASADNQVAALAMATRLLDVEYAFNGVRTLAGQALQWPRMDCPEPDSTTAQFVAGGSSGVIPKFVIAGGAGKIIVVANPWLVPGNVVPKAVVEATCEMARELLITDRTAAPVGEGLSYANEAGNQTGYDKADRRPIISAVAQAMLGKYGSQVKSKSGAVNLIRV